MAMTASKHWGVVIATAFCVLFPLWFFRYARSLWLGFDYYFDPPATSAGAATADRTGKWQKD